MTAAAGVVSLSAFRTPLRRRPGQKRRDRVTLGTTGLNVSRLAMGTGTNGSHFSSDQIRGLGNDAFAAMLRMGYDNGVTFWDSADVYGSHPHIASRVARRRPARKGHRPHKKRSHHRPADARGPRPLPPRNRHRLHRYLPAHCLTDADWPSRRQGAMEVLSEAREKGIVSAHGVSCHSFSALQTAANTDWVQVDLARVNPAGAIMDSNPAAVTAVLRDMKAKGKGIIGMKILGAGQLRHRADECFQWALAQDCVDCFTLGMQSPAELQSTLRQIPAASVRG